MTMRNRPYDVYLANHDAEVPDDPDSVIHHQVTIKHADQLRAELEASKVGLPTADKAPMNFMTVCSWAALVREGLYDGKFLHYRAHDLVDLVPVRDDAGEPVDEPVDPTQLEAESVSASSSQPSTATPPSGSTPTSTTA